MCDCKNKNSCSCSSQITGDLKYDGLDFSCLVGTELKFEIKAGDDINTVLNTVFTQICSILNGDGVTGNDGQDGQDGADGTDGSDGADGAQGTSFRFGVGVPAIGLGNDGDSYVDLANPQLRVYTKSGGVWTDTGLDMKGTAGTNGTNGTNGTDGADGSSIIQGSGVPLSGTGNVNDSYINNLNGDLYVKTDPVTWVLTGNLKSGSLLDLYGFKGEKTVDENFTSSTPFIPSFDNDTILPGYDNGNDFYSGLYYVVPKNGLNQKFVLENFVYNHGGGGTVEVQIRVNGVMQVTTGSIASVGADILLPLLDTGYLSLTVGDTVDVFVIPSGSNPKVIKAGAIFSNSFE